MLNAILETGGYYVILGAVAYYIIKYFIKLFNIAQDAQTKTIEDVKTITNQTLNKIKEITEINIKMNEEQARLNSEERIATQKAFLESQKEDRDMRYKEYALHTEMVLKMHGNTDKKDK